VAACATLWLAGATLPAAPLADHVFVISIDGGKPAVIAQSHMPTLQRLAAEGSCTWTGTTIYPSLTLPSHSSMLTGVGPERHHVLWNTWKPRKGVVGVPTLFSEAKSAGLSTAMFVGKEKFQHLLQPGSVDHFELGRAKPKEERTVLSRIAAEGAARYIMEKRPNVCFVHLSDPDDVGHKYGWGSPQQIKAFEDVDAALTEIVGAIKAAGLIERSVLIITADHGGHRKTHGTKIPDDMLVPWIAWGKNVKPGFALTGFVNTCDTTATALWLLGVTPYQSLDGKPVTSAFAWDPTSLASTGTGRTNVQVHLRPQRPEETMLRN
jgi:predicted AlkP superfamily pyrophosphatase or phosphodiesterase